MTLQELIDDLSALPASARTSIVRVVVGDVDDFMPTSIKYEEGETTIECFERGDYE